LSIFVEVEGIADLLAVGLDTLFDEGFQFGAVGFELLA
jgi:hypothetical protein